MTRIRSETLMQSVAFGIVLTVACRALGFGRGVLLVRILDPADLGTWALMANAVQVLGFVFAFGIPSGLSRYVGRFLREGIVARALALMGGALLISGILVCGLGTIFWQLLGEALFSSTTGRPLVLLTLAAVVATVAFSVVGGTLQGLKLFRANCLLELLQSAGFLVLTIAVLLGWGSSVYAPAWAHLMATVVMTLLFATWIRRRLPAPAPGLPLQPGARVSRHWQPLVVFSLGTWCAGSLQAFSRAIDRYMLLHLAHSSNDSVLDQIGQYFVASKLGQPLSALAGVLAMSLLPHTASLWEAQKRDQVERMIRLATKLAGTTIAIGGAILVLNKHFLLDLIAGRSLPYAEAVLSMVLLTVASISLHYIVRNYLLCREEAWLVTAVWLTSLVANIGLNWVLIPRYEIAGAAIATAASSGLALLLTMILASSRGLHLDRGAWIATLAPLILLAPPVTIIAWLAVLGVAVVATNHVFTSDEKCILWSWIAEKLRPAGVLGRPRARAESHLDGAKV